MTIQQTIALREEMLGQKLLKATKSEETLVNIVAIIIDHHAESMKIAYEYGLKSNHKEPLTFNVCQLPK